MTITHHLLPVEDGHLPLTIARGTGRGAALVVAPSAFGIGADLEAQMRELAATASVVIAMDPFFRGDAGFIAYDDAPRMLARLQALDRKRSYRDVLATIEHARALSEKPVVILGICFGGTYALLAAADAAVDGVVSWHGSRLETYLERAAQMRCPMRLHFGSLDPIVPSTAVDAIRTAFMGRADVEVVVHEGATHGFSHRNAAVYDEHAERAGMDAVRALVAEVGQG